MADVTYDGYRGTPFYVLLVEYLVIKQVDYYYQNEGDEESGHQGHHVVLPGFGPYPAAVERVGLINDPVVFDC